MYTQVKWRKRWWPVSRVRKSHVSSLLPGIPRRHNPEKTVKWLWLSLQCLQSLSKECSKLGFQIHLWIYGSAPMHLWHSGLFRKTYKRRVWKMAFFISADIYSIMWFFFSVQMSVTVHLSRLADCVIGQAGEKPQYND